jgi:hypothetical protein
MSLKQFLIRKLGLFFMLTTLITLAIYILGSQLDSDAQFGYNAFLSPLIYAGCCVIPSLATYSRRELKPRALAAREALQFVLTEAVVLILAFRSPGIDTSRTSVVLGIAGSVLVIYVLVFLFSWLVNSVQAKQVNDELQEFQRLHGSQNA